MTKQESNIKTALAILNDEIKGDIKSALTKMHPDYSMTWVYKARNGTLFPKQSVTKVSDMKDVYEITGRKYDIKNVTANDDTVMIEMIESYPDPESHEIYRTPEVIVLEFNNGKILRGRHYCDPSISRENIHDDILNNIYK